MKIVPIFTFLLFLAANLFAQNKPIKIGVILPLSKEFARYGEKLRVAIESVAAENIEFIYEDEQCHPGKAVLAYKKLTSADAVKIFIGPFCGSPQTAIAPMLKTSGQFALIGNEAPRALYAASGGRMLSVQHSIEDESTFNAKEIYRLGARKVVLVFFENDFSRAHEAAFRANFKGEILETIAYTSPDISALKSVALKIKTLNPDTLYLPDAYPLIQGIMREFSLLGLKQRIFSVYSAQSEDVLNAVGKEGQGLIYSYPKIGEQDAFAYFPRLAMQLLKVALQECGESVDCIIKNLKEKNNFDEYGVLKGEIGLKNIKNGKFEWFVEEKILKSES